MLGEIKILVPLENHVNVNDEIKRLNKQEANLSKEILVSESKLKNKGFLDNAPAQVVEKEKSRVLEKQQLIQEIQKQISKLKNTKN
jgi:valyl-tRNA synthetase